MGGRLALRYAIDSASSTDNPLCGVIAASPLLALAFEPPAWKLFLARRLAGIKPDFSLNRSVDLDRLSRSQQVRRDYRADPLNHELVSAALTLGFLDNGQWCLQHAAQLVTPTLLLHGEADAVTSHLATAEFAKRAGASASYQGYADCYHELVNEPEREQVVADICRWIDHRLNQAKCDASKEIFSLSAANLARVNHALAKIPDCRFCSDILFRSRTKSSRWYARAPGPRPYAWPRPD